MKKKMVDLCVALGEVVLNEALSDFLPCARNMVYTETVVQVSRIFPPFFLNVLLTCEKSQVNII